MKKLTPTQTEKIINDLAKLGRSIGGIKDPAWIVDHDDIEKYLIANTEEETDKDRNEILATVSLLGGL